MKLALLAFVAVCGWAQGPDVAISPFPANNPAQIIYNYDANGNLTSQCWAKSGQPGNTGSVSISAASNANPVSLTSTAHGFNTNSRPKITISGATVNWTPINGTFTATITGANTFTIPVDSTTFGALTGTVVFVTNAPRTNQPIWAVRQTVYNASNAPIWSGWLNGSSVFQAKCSDAGSTTIQVQ